MLDLLLEKGSDLEVVCQRGATVLHHAAEANRPDVLARLLRCAGESLVRVQDSVGWTALHYATVHEHCDCAALLIQVCSCPPACGSHLLSLNSIAAGVCCLPFITANQCRVHAKTAPNGAA